LNTRKFFGSFVIVLALLVVVNAPAAASPSDQAKGGPPDQESARQADPPGEPNPPAAERTLRSEYPLLARMLNHDSANVSRMPDGAEKLDVQGGFRSVLIVHTTTKGKRVVSCIASEKAAERIFIPKVADAPKEP
jgi:hypothetical protein